MPGARLLTTLLALVALSVFITPWRRELFAGDETKYAQVVREMRAGAFFVPTLEGSPFTHKPPLHFWMVGALTYVFGMYSLWSFVIPSLAGFFVLLWLMTRMEGELAAFICATSLMVWGSAQTARMDVTFTAAIVAAVGFVQRAFDRDAPTARVVEDAGGEAAAASRHRSHVVAAGAWTGIATLIKGPMAPVIIVVLFAFEAWRRKRVPRGGYGWAVALMAVIPLAWFIPAMIVGGGAYTREVLVKQTAGRAIGAWVHRSPFWYYIAHAPADLFPWFFLVVVAIVAAFKRGDERAKFYVSWIAAVVVPYSLLSSKLDVYMMAMIPPAALLVARLLAIDDFWLRRARIANIAMLALLALIGGAAFFARTGKPETDAILGRFDVRLLFIALAAASLAGLAIALVSRNARASLYAAGIAPLAAFAYAAAFLMPLANEMASDHPLVRALARQSVPPTEIALYAAPHVWTRDMPRDLERVRYVSAESLRERPPAMIVTSRKRSNEIGDVLRQYRRVDEFQMIGKWFDVYRR